MTNRFRGTNPARAGSHRNPDEDLRALERLAAQGDEEAAARLVVRRMRHGDNELARWYAENLALAGVDERDFKAMIDLLVRGYSHQRNTFRGPRDWAWLCVKKADEDACVLGVRRYVRNQANERIKLDEITVGFATDPNRQHRRLGSVHPRFAWDELSGVQRSDGAWTDMPAFYYTSFERRLWHEKEANTFGFQVDVIPSDREDVFMSHGCETHAPDPCHADVPTGYMFRWAERSSPDRRTFGLMEARVYVELDPITGL